MVNSPIVTMVNCMSLAKPLYGVPLYTSISRGSATQGYARGPEGSGPCGYARGPKVAPPRAPLDAFIPASTPNIDLGKKELRRRNLNKYTSQRA